MLFPRHSSQSVSEAPLLVLEYDAAGKDRVNNDVFRAMLRYTIVDAIEAVLTEGKCQSNVILAGFDRPAQEYLELLESVREQYSGLKFLILDCFSSRGGRKRGALYTSPNECDKDAIVSCPLYDVEQKHQVQVLESKITDSSGAFGDKASRGPSLLVIDSLNSLLNKHCLSKVIEFISKLRSENTMGTSEHLGDAPRAVDVLISTFRTVHNDNRSLISRIVRDTSTTHLYLSQGYKVEHAHGREQGTLGKTPTPKARVVRRKPSGRVAIEQYLALINGKGRLELLEKDATEAGHLRVNSEQDEADSGSVADMMSKMGLSFNMALSESEKQARARVALSFEHQDESLANTALVQNPRELISGFASGTDDEYDDVYGTDPEQDSEDDLDV